MIHPNDLLRSTLALEPLPGSAQRLAQLVCAEEIDVEAIAEVVSRDSGLALRTLRAANAAALGALHEITSIKAAVHRLGPSLVLSLAMGSYVQSRLMPELPQLGIAKGALWEHALASSIAVEEIRDRVFRPLPEEASTAALMHDVGKLVLAPHVQRYTTLGMQRACRDRGVGGLEAEREWCTLDHAELGGMIVRHWGLPEAIARGVAFHHDPDEVPFGEDALVPQVVQLADIVAHLSDDGMARTWVLPEGIGSSMQAIGLTAGELRRVVDAVQRRTREVADAYAA